MTVPFEQLHHRAPEPPEIVDQPLGRPAAVRGVVGQGADAGNREELGELAQQAGLLPGRRMWYP